MTSTSNHTATRCIWLEEIGSTNSEALRRLIAGEAAPFWIAASRQTAGRGRSGRTWIAPKGNLSASLALRQDAAAASPQLSLVSGLAVGTALLRCGVRAERLALKWPNDVLIGASKVAGLLVEAATAGPAALIVIGVGVNVCEAACGLERPTTSLRDEGVRVDREELLGIIDDELGKALGTWRSGAGFEAIRLAWLSLATPIGTPMSVSGAGGPTGGRFAGLDADGALLIDTDGQRQRIAFGDVSIG